MSADVTDVETALGRTLSQAERAQAEQWIADAEMLVEARLGSLELLNQDRLTFVVREAAVARFRNPEGYQSETIDDYTYRLPGETRRVTILPEWWDLLSPSTSSGAFSTRPSFISDAYLLP